MSIGIGTRLLRGSSHLIECEVTKPTHHVRTKLPEKTSHRRGFGLGEDTASTNGLMLANLQCFLIVLVLRRFAGTRTPTRCNGFANEYEYESRETWFPQSNHAEVMIENRLKLAPLALGERS